MDDVSTPTAEPERHGSVVRRRSRLILVLVALGAPIFLLAATVLVPASYAAETVIVVRGTTSDPFAATTQPGDGVDPSAERQILRSTKIAERAVELLERDDDPRDVASQLTVTANGDPAIGRQPTEQVFTLSFEAADPNLAADYARALARAYLQDRRESGQELVAAAVDAIDVQLEVFRTRLEPLLPAAEGEQTPIRVALQRDVIVTQMNELERRKANLLVRPTSPGEILTPAAVPDSPAGTPTWMNQLGALGVLVLLAVAAAFLIDRRDPALHGREELAALAGPVLSQVDHRRGRSVDDVGDDPAYRHLALHLASTPRRKLDRILLVAPRGPAAQEVATSLVITMAELGRRAVLVPCEPDPADTEVLSVADEPAVAPSVVAPHLAVVGAGELATGTVVPTPGVADLWAEADADAGGPGGGRAGVLGTFTTMLDTVTARFDCVVLSAPPLLESVIPLELSCIVDGVVLVVDPAIIDREDVESALELLGGTSAQVVGSVVVSDGTRWH